MTDYGIPSWFYEEHVDRNIWKPPFDYERTESELNELEIGLASGWKERDVQEFLKPRPHLFSGRYRGGHGTFAFSELRFGSEYVADWVIGSGSSGGIAWDLIELECPQTCPFCGDGNFSLATRKGVNQIKDWRAWISQNINTVQNSKAQLGHGLRDLNHYAYGIVVVGRRCAYEKAPGHDKFNRRRKESEADDRIRIISYDTLLDEMRFRSDV